MGLFCARGSSAVLDLAVFACRLGEVACDDGFWITKKRSGEDGNRIGSRIRANLQMRIAFENENKEFLKLMCHTLRGSVNIL